MARTGLVLFLGAGLLLGVHFLGAAEPNEDGENKLKTQLAVQKALQEGRDHLQRGNYQAAVFALESQVARIDGSREYLNALADAYRGYIRELKQSNRAAEVPTYLQRLKILDPGVVLEMAPARLPAPAAAKTVAEAPAPKADATERKPLPLAALAGMQPEKKARGRSEEQSSEADPFDEDNRASSPRARELLSKAESEFGKENFTTASRLYAQACQEDERLTAECGERWAYCKLRSVAESLNNGPPDSVRDVEREIQTALALARSNAKLEAFGKEQQRRLVQVGRGGKLAEEAAPIEVKHTPRGKGQSWAIAETTNFRILHNQPAEVAEHVARTAESARLAAARKWFNDDGAAWKPICDVCIYTSRTEYQQQTRMPMDSPGHSDIGSDGNRVVSRKIHLSGEEKGMLTHVLPHEVTHIVLADRFDGRPVPRWADEAMAVLSEPRERVERHLTNLTNHRRDSQLFTTRELLTLDRYPQASRIGAFYAQSVSLVDYLSSRKSPDVFTQFMRDAMKSGYEPSLQRHYGIRDLQELDQQWQQHAFGGGTGSPTVAGKIR